MKKEDLRIVFLGTPDFAVEPLRRLLEKQRACDSCGYEIVGVVTMPDKMINKGIEAMLRNLDPYTVYYPEDKDEELKMMTTGKYAGVGSTIRFHKDKNTTVFTGPYENMPAFKAGVRAGDAIISIDGKKTEGLSVDSVSDMLRGEPGTKLTVVVERPGKKEKR